MYDHISQQANECYKNLNKNMNCSNCIFAITHDNYKKGRTVCKLCYDNYVLAYYKNRFFHNSSP